MNIRFPDVDEHYIKTKVEAGFYMNETELVRDAVRHMREEDERKNQFLSAIKVGQDQVASGQHRELTPDVSKRTSANRHTENSGRTQAQV